MFIGHYGVSFALKKFYKNISLGWLFIGAQLVDIIFYPFVLLGIEKMTIMENYTPSTHFRLDYVPYTHSLLATFIWGALSYVFVYFISNKDKFISMIVAASVMSHWFLDLIVHTKDLPLWHDQSMKFGFGLWNYPVLTYILEAVLLLGGLVIYMKSTTPVNNLGKYGMIIFSLILLVINAVNIFGPLTDHNIAPFAFLAIFLYFLFALVTFWLDKKRA